MKTFHFFSVSKEAPPRFEDLSNELLHQIFDFLDFSHTYQAFSPLNARFQCLFTRSNLPIKMNLSIFAMSKSTFQHFCEDMIIPHQNQITSLDIENVICFDFSPNLILPNFTRLETLRLQYVTDVYLGSILKDLMSLTNLSSLSIVLAYQSDLKDFFGQILRLPVLKYFKVSTRSDCYYPLDQLPFANNKYSFIEHLILDLQINVDNLDALLSYVPHLHRLSTRLSGYSFSSSLRNAVFQQGRYQRKYVHLASTNLTHAKFKFDSINFDDFEIFITNYFPKLQVLRFFASKESIPIDYLNVDRWKQLILSSKPCLRILDMHLTHRFFSDDNYDDLFHQFAASLSLEPQWLVTPRIRIGLKTEETSATTLYG